MKRTDFLRTFALASGGLVVLGCEKEVVSELIASPDLGPISAIEAKEWFEQVYLNQYANARLGGKNAHKRKTNWDGSKELKNERGQDFVWTPISYETDEVPAILNYSEETEYRKALAKYYVHPIVEGLVVVKENGKKKAFLAQIAYDPYDVKKKGRLDLSTFTGWLIRAEWDDALIAGTAYKDGRKLRSFDKQKEKGGRPALCYQETITYTTVTGHSCGPGCTEVTITEHRYVQTTCSGASAGGGDPTGDGGGSSGYYSPGVTSGTGGASGNGDVATSLNYIPRNFGINHVVHNPASPDRRFFNENLSNVAYATGLATNLVGWNFDIAEDFARVLGAELKTFYPLAEKAGGMLGWAGLALDGYQFYLGVAKDGYQWDGEEGWNGVQVLLSGVGVVAGIYALPWVAVGTGVISISIAVYTQATSNPD